jgi:hypothetical protein
VHVCATTHTAHPPTHTLPRMDAYARTHARTLRTRTRIRVHTRHAHAFSFLHNTRRLNPTVPLALRVQVSKLLRAPQRELEWKSDLVIDAVVQVRAMIPRIHTLPLDMLCRIVHTHTRTRTHTHTHTHTHNAQTGAVARLATFLERHDDHKLQSEAANALANISAGTSDNTCAVIEAGVVRVHPPPYNASVARTHISKTKHSPPSSQPYTLA